MAGAYGATKEMDDEVRGVFEAIKEDANVKNLGELTLEGYTSQVCNSVYFGCSVLCSWCSCRRYSPGLLRPAVSYSRLEQAHADDCNGTRS